MQSLEYLSNRHRAYLLYCWEDSVSDLSHPLTWRFAIMRVPCLDRRQGLASLSDLVSFLQNELYPAQEIDAARYEAESESGENPDSRMLHNSAGEAV